jgi:RecA-family ATPase
VASADISERFFEASGAPDADADIDFVGLEPDPPQGEDEPREAPAPFEGLTHDEVLELEVEGARVLVEELVETGTVGTVAGIPETYKTWLAQEIAVAVARGEGEILGRPVVQGGPVGYFWQDDSTRNEVERIRTRERARSNPPGLALTWYLNAGLRLPDELARMRMTIEQEGFVLVVLDSFYNVAPGISLKDEDAAVVITALKVAVCDPTGCAFLIVDHAPWPTDANRGQRRAYGSVLKGAAIRWGIYLEREGSDLHIEARGNNIRGFARQRAYWDEETLELRLLDIEHVAGEEYEERVLAYLAEHPWATTEEVDKDPEGREIELRNARKRLAQAGRLTSAPSAKLGRPGKAMRWNLAPEAEFNPVPLPGTGRMERAWRPSRTRNPVPPSPTP